VSQVYRSLLIISTFFVSLSVGSNDVANAISPLVYLIKLDDPNGSTVPAFLIGGFGIAFGLMLLGPKVMETIGKNIIKLDY